MVRLRILCSLKQPRGFSSSFSPPKFILSMQKTHTHTHREMLYRNQKLAHESPKPTAINDPNNSPESASNDVIQASKSRGTSFKKFNPLAAKLLLLCHQKSPPTTDTCMSNFVQAGKLRCYLYFSLP